MTPPDQPISSLEGAFTSPPWDVLPDGERIISTKTYDTICEVPWKGSDEPPLHGGTVQTVEERNANARLIAAAPTMADALQEALDALDSLPVEFVDTVIDQARANARAALLQALGAEK